MTVDIKMNRIGHLVITWVNLEAYIQHDQDIIEIVSYIKHQDIEDLENGYTVTTDIPDDYDILFNT